MSVRRWIAIALVSCSHALCQQAPSRRGLEHLTVHGAQRLAALAKVGALTRTTMLIEVGDMSFMQSPVNVHLEHGTVRQAVQRIMGAAGRYKLRERRRLLILSTATVDDRLLTLRIGHLAETSGHISSLAPSLAEALREASGCKVMGTAWAGPEVPVNVPRIDVFHANFEKIVALVAGSPDASMWVFEVRKRPVGCIDDPGTNWEVGAYGFGKGFSSCQMPFAGAAGPQFVDNSPPGHAFPDKCTSSDSCQ